MFTLHCINLDIRNDRMNNILKIFSNQNFFKIKRFNAIKNDNGALGCLSSHLEIIKSNYNEPYIIVIEDDIILKENIENIYNLIKLLIEKISEWVIFNGNPSFWSLENKNNIIHSIIKDTPFININWGQSTAFMIYSKNCYDKLINLLENSRKNFYKNSKPIDILISENFTQTTYNKGHLIYQREDWSNINNTINVNYIKYQKPCEKLLLENISNRKKRFGMKFLK